MPSNTPTQDDTKDNVTLQVSDQNTCYWNKELIGMDEVAARIEQYKTTVAVPRILIAGDDKANFGAAVQVLDLVRKAGITQVSVETRDRATGK